MALASRWGPLLINGSTIVTGNGKQLDSPWSCRWWRLSNAHRSCFLTLCEDALWQERLIRTARLLKLAELHYVC